MSGLIGNSRRHVLSCRGSNNKLCRQFCILLSAMIFWGFVKIQITRIANLQFLKLVIMINQIMCPLLTKKQKNFCYVTGVHIIHHSCMRNVFVRTFNNAPVICNHCPPPPPPHTHTNIRRKAGTSNFLGKNPALWHLLKVM